MCFSEAQLPSHRSSPDWRESCRLVLLSKSLNRARAHVLQTAAALIWEATKHFQRFYLCQCLGFNHKLQNVLVVEGDPSSTCSEGTFSALLVLLCFSVSNWTRAHTWKQSHPLPRSAGNPVRYQHPGAHYYLHLSAALLPCVSNPLLKDKEKRVRTPAHSRLHTSTAINVTALPVVVPFLDKGEHRSKPLRKYNRMTHLLCLIASAWRGQKTRDARKGAPEEQANALHEKERKHSIHHAGSVCTPELLNRRKDVISLQF